MTTREIKHVIGSFADVPLAERAPEPAAVDAAQVTEYVRGAAAGNH